MTGAVRWCAPTGERIDHGMTGSHARPCRACCHYEVVGANVCLTRIGGIRVIFDPVGI